MSLWKEGQRKLVYGGAAFVALCGGAWPLKATFSEFATAMGVWLASMLAAHVTAEKLGKAATTP